MNTLFWGFCHRCSLPHRRGRSSKFYKEYYKKRWFSSLFLNGVLMNLHGLLVTELHRGLLEALKCFWHSLTTSFEVFHPQHSGMVSAARSIAGRDNAGPLIGLQDPTNVVTTRGRRNREGAQFKRTNFNRGDWMKI